MVLIEPCIAALPWIDRLPTPLLPHDAAIPSSAPAHRQTGSGTARKGQEAPQRIENGIRVLSRKQRAVRALHTTEVRKGVTARFPDALENLLELRHRRETDAPAAVLKLRNVRRKAEGRRARKRLG